MIVGQFANAASLRHARAQLRGAALGPVETFTPAPLDASDDQSSLPLVILLGGTLTGAASFLLQCYAALIAYPFDIGGRPNFAWPSFVPTAFENAVLGAIAAGFFGYLIVSHLPRLYDPVDDIPIMRNASSNGWMLQLSVTEPDLLRRARDLMLEHGAVRVEERVP